MNIKRIHFIVCVSFFTAVSIINAQITIGSSHKSNTGTLLDLKQESDGSSKKGLLLPRVDITEKDKLHPMLPLGYNATEDAKHTGLWVYNTNFVDDICPGPYAWSGTEWNKLLGEPCYYLKASPLVLNFRKTPAAAKSVALNFYPTTLTHSFTEAGSIAGWTDFPTDGLSQNAYNFRPATNPGGTALSSTVTVSVVKDGVTRSQDIVIHQSADDLKFEYTPTTAFPPLAGNHNLTVTSEADWKVALNNNTAMFSSFPTAEQPKGESQTIPFTLTDNPTYANRVATLRVTSADPDFVPKDMNITQGFKAPFIEILDPVSRVIDFGTSTAARHIKFKTNSGWTTLAADNWRQLIGSWVPALLVEQPGSTNALVDKEETITVIPTAGSEAAGTRVTTTVDLATRNHPGAASPTPTTITIHRTVPARWSQSHHDPAWGSVYMPRVGASTSATVYANTNTWWKLRANTGAETEMDADRYALRSQTLSFSDNDTWVDRYVNISATTDNVNYTEITAYMQLGYRLNLTYNPLPVSPATVPQAATGYTFGFATDALTNSPNFELVVTNNSAGGGWIANNNDNVGSRGITIPSNDSWNTRQLGFHYSRPGFDGPGTPGWVNFHIVDQLGWSLNLRAPSSSVTTNIPAGGASYYAYLHSPTATPNYNMQIQYTDGEAPNFNGPYNVQDQWGNSNASFYIKPNPTTNARHAYVYYERPGKEWVHIGAFYQDGQPWTDAGGWWIHNQTIPTQVAAFYDEYAFRSPTKASQICSNAYGAEWQAIWQAKSKDTESGGENWVYSTEAFDAGISASIPFTNWSDGSYFSYSRSGGQKRLTGGFFRGNPQIQMPWGGIHGEVKWGETTQLIVNLVCAKRK